jgi:hypothetical protein
MKDIIGSGMIPAITPELQTLLACARTSLCPTQASAIGSALHGRFDHARFLSLTTAHTVVPLVYRNLKATCWNDLPAASRTELEDYVTANTGRNRFLTAELIRLLKIFESVGIQAVPFKGPALAASAYGSIALREFTDLDILVRQRDLAPVARMLQERGYQSRERSADMLRAAFLRNECEQGFWGLGDSTLVEIHWRLAQRYFDFPFPLESLWENLAETEMEGCRVLAFPPENQLLFLCVHGARHLWSHLKWICDVAEQIRMFPNLDWQLAFHQAAIARNERTLLLGLALADRLLGADLPPWVRTRVECCPDFAPVIAGIVERLETLAEPGILQIAGFHMARRAGAFQKLRQCALILACPSGRDWAAGPALLPLLALRRPFRLFWKYR